MQILVLLIAIPAAAVMAAVVGFRRAGRSPAVAARAVRVAVPAAALAAVAYGFLFPSLVRQLSSSTSGLSFLGLPLLATAVGVAAFAVAWAIGVAAIALTRLATGRAAVPWRSVAVAIPVLVAGAAGVVTYAQYERTYRVARAPESGPAELADAVRTYRDRERLHAIYSAFLLRTGSNHVLARVAVHPRTPEEVLLVLVADADASVRWRAWRHPAFRPETLRRLATSNDPAVRNGVASNERTPPEVLRALAQDPAMDGALYQNKSLPDDAVGPVLRRLVAVQQGQFTEYSRASIARHLRAPADLLEEMSRDPAPVVREAVAFNARTPPGTLERLAGDPDRTVRRGVAGNRATPPALLEALAEDADELVRGMARGNPGLRSR